jgi:ketosteroid isomerase-like protein
MFQIGLIIAIAVAAPSGARWSAASPAVGQAVKHPRVAAALAARTTLNAALVAGDSTAFANAFMKDAMVNSPYNNIASAAEAARRSRSGALTYVYLHTSIEHAAPRRDDEVVFMGEETYQPPAGGLHAGKTVRRRFTDLWRRDRGRWRLSLRQATIFSVE